VDIGSLTGKLVLEDQMSAVLKKAEDALDKFGESASGQAKKMSNFGTAMTSVGKSITALSVPIMAVGGAALAAGYSIEGAYNTIARKTGETGEALGALKKDFEAVFVTVPNSAQEVATAIADVHQRLGLTGDELQTVTKKFIDFANVNSVDVATATKTVSTLMSALAKDTNLTKEEIGAASGIMDKLTYASQISGASVGKLAEGVVKGGVAFVEMGFSLNESLALFAQFEKVGANTTDVTTSLGKVMSDLAKQGVTDLAGAFKGIIKDIRDTDTFAQAVTKSVDTFGAIAGRKLAEEIKGGTYSIDELAETISKLGNVTQDTAKQSESFNESLGTLKNQITLALAPVGIQMIESFKKLIPAIQGAIEVIAKMVELFSKLPSGVQTFILALGGIIVAIGPVIIALGAMYEKFLLLGGAKGIAWVGAQLTQLGVTAAVTSAAINIAMGAGALALVVAFGYAVLEVVNAFKKLAAFKGTTWEFFTQRDEDNIVRMGLKYIGILDDTKKRLTDIELPASAAGAAIVKTGEATDAGAESFDMYAARMNKLNKDAMQPLSAQTQEDITRLHGLNYEVEQIAKGTGASVPAVKKFIEQLEKGEKATEAFSKALRDLGGQTAIEGAQEIVRQLGAMNGPLNVLPSKLAGMAAALEEGAKAAAHMGQADLASQYRLLAKSLDPVVLAQQRYNITFSDYIDKVPQAILNTEELDEQLARLSGDVITFGNDWQVVGDLVSTMDLSSMFVPFKAAVSENKPNVFANDWKKSIGEIGDTFGDMFEGINSGWGQTIKILGEGMEVMVDSSKSMGAKVSAGFAMAASTLGSVLDTFTEDSGGKWGAAAMGALSGAGAGAAIGTLFAPGVGTAVGAGVGAAVGAVTGWISATKKAAEAQAEATAEVKKLQGALVAQYGSLENLEDISMRLFGMSFVGEWGNQGAEGLKKMTEFTRDFEERLAAVTDAVNKMITGYSATTSVLTEGFDAVGASVTKAQENYDKLAASGTATQEQLRVAQEAVTIALENQHAVGTANVQMLADLGVQGVATFSAVYMATGSYTEALAAVAPAMSTLNQAYMDLGLQVDDVLLSHLMLQAGVLEGNPALMAAIDGQAGAMQGMAQMGLLNAETFAAMQRTGTELYARLQAETAAQAAATGNLGDTTVDALMPMQTYLHEATVQAELLGLPLDANTQMLIDQSKELGIWKEAGATAQDKLIKGMDQLVGKLDQMLSNLGAMTGLLSNMPDAESTVTVNHVDRYQAIYLQDINENANSQNRAGGGIIYAAGGFVPHGSDTVPAMLTPGERVLTTSENEQYENEKTDKSSAQMASSIDRLTDAILSQNDALMVGLRDIMMERG